MNKILLTTLFGLALSTIAPIVPAARAQASAEKLPEDPAVAEAVKKIHAEIIHDRKLSADARAVKLIPAGNRVMVRGAVHSEAERTTILTTAKKYAGDTNVVDQLIIPKR